MKFRSTPLLVISLTLTSPLWGNGFNVPVQSPEATSRGNAWLATANSAAAVYYNAAGLTQLESPELHVGVYGVKLGLEADLDSGTHEKADNNWAALPQIYAAIPINDKLVGGVGLNTPFGLATDWGQNSQFRLLSTETELQYLTGWFVMGYEVTDTWSVGGGFGVSRADLTFGRFTTVAPGVDLPSRFVGDDEALSWTISTRWAPTEQHAFGLVYRSKTDFKLKGDFEITGAVPEEDASLDFMTPASLAGGYAYSPCKEWTFEANVEWMNWDQFNSFDLKSPTTGSNTTPFNWNSNFIYSVGATRFLEDGWSISAGYNFIENSIPDHNFSPGVSDANRHWLNAGFGRKCESFSWNFAYQYAFSDRDVDNSPGGLADGTFKSRFHGIMLDFDWQF
ncbi:MAG: outer membrane protein transport protein [Verrucomicrobiota bacterium]